MPFTDNGYVADDEEDIYDELTTKADEEYDAGELEPFEGSINRSLLRAYASLIADEIEPTLAQLYDDAYIERATGNELDLRCADIGIDRKPALEATGVVRFFHGSAPSNTYTIPSGTRVQTDGSDPVSYDTLDTAQLRPLDTFDSGSLDSSYNGDTADFSVQSTTAVSGSALTTTTASALIYDDTKETEDGDRIDLSVRVGSGGSLETLYHVTDANNYYAVQVDASANELSVVKADGGTRTDEQSVSVTVPTAEFLTLVIDTAVNGGDDVTLTDDGTDIASLTFDDTDDDAYTEGALGFRNTSDTTAVYWDEVTRPVTAATVEAVNGGTVGNVAAGAIRVAPSPIDGVETLTNPRPTGDTAYVDTRGRQLTTGRPEESDEDLRDRALRSTALGGAATDPAVGTALREIDDVNSVRVFENDTLTDNTGSGGLPEVSIEAVVYGGADADIAQTLHDTVGLTGRLYSGAHGTSTTYDIDSDTLDQTVTYEWSRPPTVAIDIDVDLLVEDGYVGDSEIKSIIVEYVGGTDVDGSTVVGTGIGEDIRVDALRDRLVGDDTGVLGVRSYTIDDNDDGTDDTTTVDGITVYDVPDDSVATTDATDGSITITTTEA